MNETEIQLTEKDNMAMKLLHYFITEKGYNLIMLQGVENEYWLENLNEDYKIVRIVASYIHNDEQYKFDVFKTNRILRKIKAKTLSFKLQTLSIFLDLGNTVHLDDIKDKEVTAIELKEDEDVKENTVLKNAFPDLEKKMTFTEKGLELFVKITNDINARNATDQKKMDQVFSFKKPIITYILIAINFLVFFVPMLFGSEEAVYNFGATFGPFIRMGQYYRLFTGAFIHAGIFHLLFNMYALWIIGSQLESFIGKTRYIFVYLFSILTASLLSIIMNGNVASVGASGAIFGLLGALLYFGYHYRVYLGGVIRSQIIPVIIANLALGFIMPGVDNAAHIGGLIGGFLIMIGLGVQYKSSTFEKINGMIVAILYLLFLLYMAFVFVH